MKRRKRVLVVDDDAANREHLEVDLSKMDLDVVLSSNGSDALAMLTQAHDLVLIDVMMPFMDGFELTRRIRSESVVSDIPICMVTALLDMDTRLRAVEAGANDFIAKPVDKTELRVRVISLLKLKESQDEVRDYRTQIEKQNSILDARVRKRTGELEDARLEILLRLARAAEYRDEDTAQHTQRVGRRAGLLGRAIGLPEEECKMLELAGPLHDIGKIGISDSILLKPGKLSTHEFDVMKSHTTIGAKMLAASKIPVLIKAEEIALSHHEKWDGSGYPAGLSGEAIPLSGRILAVVDVFDALSNDRPYRKAWSRDAVLDHLLEGAGSHFDPDVVASFVNMINPGTATCRIPAGGVVQSLFSPGEREVPVKQE